MEDTLANRFIPSFGVMYVRDRTDTNLHREMDQEMRTMENLDLEKYRNVAILGRRSIPSLLCRVSQKPRNIIPGDKVFEFRCRAKKLLDKWKPFIMRDILHDSLVSPYIWRYERDQARLLRRHPFDESADEVRDLQNLLGEDPGPYNVIAVSSADPYGEPLVETGDFEGSTIQRKATIPAGTIVQISVADPSDDEPWPKNITVTASDDSSCVSSTSVTSGSTTTSTTDSTNTDSSDGTEDGGVVPVGAASACQASVSTMTLSAIAPLNLAPELRDNPFHEGLV
ncbi:hypothetical protein EST38_g4592 [Candolleomyces aberdarensis]|uniref:Uncharacterized protein n=1 Tax=Candolleomyces aberdarensis TaxID=2316362 RepID=A0A4Q2DPA7_9AGAR|nr:hypothetical protein EST38_g4592 [Candolleomyces aberdarensis]